MTGKKGMKHYLVRLNREVVRLYQEITELPGRTFIHQFFHGVDLPLDHFRKF